MDTNILFSMIKVIAIVIGINYLRGGRLKYLINIGVSLLGFLAVVLVIKGTAIYWKEDLIRFLDKIRYWIRDLTWIKDILDKDFGIIYLILGGIVLLGICGLLDMFFAFLNDYIFEPIKKFFNSNRQILFIKNLFFTILTTIVIYVGYAEKNSPDHVMSCRGFGQWLFVDDSSNNFILNLLAILIASIISFLIPIIIGKIYSRIINRY